MGSLPWQSPLDRALRTTFVGGLSVGSIYGMSVCVVPDRPRYELPAEVMPGVPWPAGFREEINAWAASFLGRSGNLLEDGRSLVDSANRAVYVNPRTFESLRRSREFVDA